MSIYDDNNAVLRNNINTSSIQLLWYCASVDVWIWVLLELLNVPTQKFWNSLDHWNEEVFRELRTMVGSRCQTGHQDWNLANGERNRVRQLPRTSWQRPNGMFKEEKKSEWRSQHQETRVSLAWSCWQKFHKIIGYKTDTELDLLRMDLNYKHRPSLCWFMGSTEPPHGGS